MRTPYERGHMNHIELFAGCGGMSLGFHSEDFNLVMANELSPMAAETFSYNFFQQDLRSTSLSLEGRNTLFLDSQYPANDLSKRLSEIPMHNIENKDRFPYSDVLKVKSLKGKLIVGNIISLNMFLKNNPSLLRDLTSEEVDVVSGGPPCQGFSMAGLRKKDDKKNSLPFHFIEFIKLIKPKFFVLENVIGILQEFKGEGYKASTEISRYTAKSGYVPICMHVNTEFIGMPQSRPRFIMISIREDVFKKIHGKHDNVVLSNSFDFFEDFHSKEPTIHLPHKERTVGPLFQNPILRFFNQGKKRTTYDAISDLGSLNASTHESTDYSNYAKYLNSVFPPLRTFSEIANLDVPESSMIVRQRFQVYQIFNQLASNEKKEVKSFLQNIHHIHGSFGLKEYFHLKEEESSDDFVSFILKTSQDKKRLDKLLKYFQKHEHISDLKKFFEKIKISTVVLEKLLLHDFIVAKESSIHFEDVEKVIHFFQNFHTNDLSIEVWEDLKKSEGISIKTVNNLRKAVKSRLPITSKLVQDFVNKRIIISSLELCKFDSKLTLLAHLYKIRTKKISQHSLVSSAPSPTIKTIADDVCHFSKYRTISVREMARLQSFPDWFVFRSKRTTGGKRRQVEVPQQTQVGNAVPPLLGKQIAACIKYLDNLSK